MESPANYSGGSSSAGTVILTSIGAWAASIFVGVPVTIFMLLLLGIPLRLPQLPRSSYASRYPTPTYAPPPVPVRSRQVVPEIQRPTRTPAVVPGPPPVSPRTTGEGFRLPATNTPGSATNIAVLKPGQRVFVKWGNTWYPATVISPMANDKVGIHYDAHTNSWDEQVPQDRVREMRPDEIARYGPGDANLAVAKNPLPETTPSGSAKPVFGEMRTWHRADGRVLVEARLVSATSQEAMLHSKGGLSVIVGLELLSSADQAYVRALAPAGP